MKSRALWSLFLTMLPGVQACQPDYQPDTPVQLRVLRWPSGAQRLRVLVSINGRPQTELSVTNPETPITLPVLSGVRGRMSVEVMAWGRVPGSECAEKRTPGTAFDAYFAGAVTQLVLDGETELDSRLRDVELVNYPKAACEAVCAETFCADQALSPNKTTLYFWSDRPENLWAVGNQSFIARRDSEKWYQWGLPVPETSATPQPDLQGVWGDLQGALWAVGKRGTVQRWDGNRWTPETATAAEGSTSPEKSVTSDLHAIWGTLQKKDCRDQTACNPLTTAAWIVGADGSVLQYAEASRTWMAQKAPTKANLSLNAIFGFEGGDIWIAGNGGTLLRAEIAALTSSPKDWKQVDSPTTADLHGLWGSGPSDVWAVGDGGVILHNTGDTWKTEESGTSKTLYAVWGHSSGDVWVVGEAGTVLRRTMGPSGAFWQPIQTGLQGDIRNISGSVDAGGKPKLWISDDRGSVYPGDGRQFETGTLEINELKLSKVWIGSAHSIWATADTREGSRLYHYDGAHWSLRAGPKKPALTALSGSLAGAAEDLWAGDAEGDLYRWEAGLLRKKAQLPSSKAVLGLWESPARKLWGVNGEAPLWRVDTKSSAVNPECPDPGGKRMLITVSGTGESSVMGGGYSGNAVHWTGMPECSDAPLGSTGAVEQVYVDSVGTPWVIHYGSQIQKYSKRVWFLDWKPMPGMDMVNLTGIYSDGTEQVWAVGNGNNEGLLLQRDQLGDWHPQTLGAQPLLAVGAGAGKQVVIVAENGQVARRAVAP